MSVIQSKKTLDGKFKADIEFFDSTMDCVRSCKIREITNRSFDNMQEKHHDESWSGVKSYHEALEIMNDGWSKEVKGLKAITEKCKQLQTEKRISFQNEVSGFAPVVPLALLCVPNSMINSRYKPIKSKIVSIYYDIAVGAFSSAKDITQNGKKVTEAIIRLEQMGYRVNLNIVDSYTSSDMGNFLVIQLKKANQHLDLKRICFPMMHAAMNRVISFDWYSKFPKGKYIGGYGQSLANRFSDNEKINQIAKELFGKDAIYISASIIQDKDVDYLIEVLKEGKYV